MVGQYNIRSTFRTHAIVDRPAQRRRSACGNAGDGGGRRGRVGYRSRSRNNAPSTFPHNRGIGTHDKGAIVTLFNRTGTRVGCCRGCQVGNHNLIDIVGTRPVLHTPFQSHRRTSRNTGYGGVVSGRVSDGSAARYHTPCSTSNRRIGSAHSKDAVVTLFLVDAGNGCGRKLMVGQYNIRSTLRTHAIVDRPAKRRRSACGNACDGGGRRGRVGNRSCSRNNAPSTFPHNRGIGTHDKGAVVTLFNRTSTRVGCCRGCQVGNHNLVDIVGTRPVLHTPLQSNRRTSRNTGYGSVVSRRIGDGSAARYDTPGAGTYCRIGSAHSKDAVVTLLLVDARNGR